MAMPKKALHAADLAHQTACPLSVAASAPAATVAHVMAATTAPVNLHVR